MPPVWKGEQNVCKLTNAGLIFLDGPGFYLCLTR